MKTLYDLLEALPDDDADGLRAAFRKAAKANHPDFNPGNAEASERFRRIVRANAILSDQQQRAEYDRLLELAKRQQSQQSRQPKRRSRSSVVRWLAADALMSALVSVMLIGGYLVYRSAERSPLSAAQAGEMAKVEMAQAEPAQAEPAQAVVIKPTEITEASSRAVQYVEPPTPGAEANTPEHDVDQQAAGKPTKPEAPAPVTDGTAAIVFAPPPGDNGVKDIAFYRERGMRAYRSGELYLALANFGVAIDLDPGSPDSYVDRGIVFHRLGDLRRALSDVAEAKRLDDLNRKQSTPRIGPP
jgi:tetratricopeptide (TPR) repeat protein